MSQEEHSNEEDKENALNLDELFDNLIGAHGLWQTIIVLLICCSTSSTITFPIYANSIPKFRCKLDLPVENLLIKTMFQFNPIASNNHSKRFLSFDEIAKLIGPWPADPTKESMHSDKFGCHQYYINATKIDWLNIIANKSKNQNIALTKPCSSGYVYQPWPYQFPNTIVEEWDLVCDSAWKGPFSTSVYMFGMMFGFILGGFLGDSIGRKNTIYGASIFEFIFGISVSFSPNFEVYVALRTLVSAACTTKVTAISVLLVEMTTSKYRSIFCAIWSIYFNFLARGLHAFIAMYLPSWRGLHLFIMSPSIIGLIALYFLPESPRWLISIGRKQEAGSILYKAYCINKRFRTLPHENLTKMEFFTTLNLKEPQIKSLSTSFFINIRIKLRKQCFKLKNICSMHGCSRFMSKISAPYRLPGLARVSVISTCIFACQLCTFFGIMYYSSIVRESIYLIAFINACTSLPATILSTVLYNRARSRNRPLVAVYLLAAVSLLTGGLYTTIMQPESELPLVISCNVALVLLGASFNMIFIYIPELFPSVIRTQGLGNASGLGRVGGIVCSFINILDTDVRHGLPVVVFGIVTLFEILLIWCIPDTTGDDLKDSIAPREIME